jgi:chromosome segregation ATPase
MNDLEMIIHGLERQIDNLHREIDLRGRAIEQDHFILQSLQSRIQSIEQAMTFLLSRLHLIERALNRLSGKVKGLEANSPIFKILEILAPTFLVLIAVWYRVPVENIKALVGAIK